MNASKFGLQVGVFTDSIAKLWRCYDGIEVGAGGWIKVTFENAKVPFDVMKKWVDESYRCANPKTESRNPKEIRRPKPEEKQPRNSRIWKGPELIFS